MGLGTGSEGEDGLGTESDGEEWRIMRYCFLSATVLNLIIPPRFLLEVDGKSLLQKSKRSDLATFGGSARGNHSKLKG